MIFRLSYTCYILQSWNTIFVHTIQVNKTQVKRGLLPFKDVAIFDGIKIASAMSFQIDIFVLVMSGRIKDFVVVLFPLLLKATTWITENINVFVMGFC